MKATRTLVAALLFCSGCVLDTGEEKTFCCSSTVIAVERGGEDVEDVALWTLVVVLPDRKLSCVFTRGSWRCDDPSWAGSGSPSKLGLPRSSFLASSPRQSVPAGPFAVEAFRNGERVFAGQTRELSSLPVGLSCKQAARFRHVVELSAGGSP